MKKRFLQSRGNTLRHAKGFSLIELLVVCAIFIIMSSVVLVDQNKFSNGVSLNNLAYEIALQIRQAQVYGLSVRQNTSSSFNTGYGIHFQKTAGVITFLMFADNNINKVYDPIVSGVGDPVVNSFSLREGNTISDVCDTSGATTRCLSTGAITSLDITFKRPDPSAYIIDSVGKGLTPMTEMNTATISLSSAQKNLSKNILIVSTGQISVQ